MEEARPVIVLALDTSSSACSAAVWRDGAVLARRFEAMARGQSEALMPMVVAVMAEAGLDYPELSLIGVTVGPGAFTGIRIGLAAARGLGLAAGLPVAGVTTPAAIARATTAAERAGRTVLVAVESKRTDLFVQPFDEKLRPLAEIAALPPEAVAETWGQRPLLLAGDGAARLAPLLPDTPLSEAPGAPDAAQVAAAAAEAWTAGTALPPRPLYLAPPAVTLPKPR